MCRPWHERGSQSQCSPNEVQRSNLVKMLAGHCIILLAAVGFIYCSLFHSTFILSPLDITSDVCILHRCQNTQVTVLVFHEWYLCFSLCWLQFFLKSVTIIFRSPFYAAALNTVILWWAQGHRLWAHFINKEPRFSHCPSQSKGQMRS